MKRRRILVTMVVALLAAMAPVFGLRSVGAAKRVNEYTGKLATPAIPAGPTTLEAATAPEVVPPDKGMEGHQSPAVIHRLGIDRPAGVTDMTAFSQEVGTAAAQQLSHEAKGGAIMPQAGEPENINAGAAMSAAIAVTLGGRDTQFDEVSLLGDWDGREDFAADHSGKIDDFSGKVPTVPTGPSNFTLTRVAISEHTIANGFAEDIFYYGDSFGNLYVASTTNVTQATPTPNVFAINLPTVLNAFGSLNSDDQIVVTGLTVNPVADLGSFARVNGAYAPFNGLVGEILYVSFWDTGSGFRLLANGTLIRSGVLAFPVADIVSAATAPPGIVSPTGFPVQVGGAFGVAFSVFGNLAGICCDDDGSIYFQQVDLIQFTGGNIVKIASADTPGIPGVQVGFQDRSLATSGFFTLSTLNPLNGAYGSASGNSPSGAAPPGNPSPVAANVQVSVGTNYSGTSSLFGNIATLGCGPCNTVYAGVSRSLEPGDPLDAQNREGLFSTAASTLGATPSMVIRFADVVGSFAPCTIPQNPATGQFIAGVTGLPIGNGIADAAVAGVTLVAGVNNFRVFVLGDGPDLRSATSASAAVGATNGNTLRIPELQIDYTAHSGVTSDELGTVFVVSGGTPAGIATNPSPRLGEVLAFPDECPADGRADFIDLRGAATLPNPPVDGNVGDGQSTRTDHIFWQAPLDGVTATPTGIAGLSRGFLLYTNRTRPLATNHTPGLPNGGVQGDDTSNGPNYFEQFDPSHQVAGGDDQVFPFTGDDDNGAGNPATAGPLSGGFEFLFANPLGDVFQVGAACGTGNGVWNAFFLNSNGNITFGAGDTSNIANVPGFRAGPPKIAGAWADLNPGSRAGGFANTFPVQACGLAGVNAFEVRYINVPEFGFEACGSSNTFSITLFDDGTGIDENANQPLNPANPIGNNAVPFDLQEGPTALRFTAVTIAGTPTQSVIVGCPPRPDGTGQFCLDYCRMDLLGTSDNPVIAGFSIGAQNPLNPPGLCSTNLSRAAVAADGTQFLAQQPGDVDIVAQCLLGEGTEPEIFEFFSGGKGPSIGSGGEITLTTPAFDLRFEGNDSGLAAAIQTRQQDRNRGQVCFFGTTCQLPPNPLCLIVLPTLPVAVPPGDPAVGSAAAASPNGSGVKVASPTSGIINGLCNIQLNVVGCGFFPNLVTTICQGFADQTGIPLQRPGKTVSTALTVGCDTDGNGVPDLFIALTGVTPISPNLVKGTLQSLVPQLPGTAFPLTCCGGFATLNATVTFTAGNNNIFNLLPTGGFTRSTTCSLDLGLRAPVVISVSPSGPADCANPQDLILTGACFVLPNGTANVTSVFAVDAANPNNIIQAIRFAILGPNVIDALFSFGSANAGHTFLIFASGPNGTSRNLTTLPVGAPAGCPTGNEEGIPVSFTCQSGAPILKPSSVLACSIDRPAGGGFTLTVLGTGFKPGIVVKIGTNTVNKVKFKSDTKLVLKGICGFLPGPIVVQNVGEAASDPKQCNETCAGVN